MARRGNYGFEKRQKEIKRKQKADAKADRRRAQREATDQPPASDAPTDHDAALPVASEAESGSLDPDRDAD